MSELLTPRLLPRIQQRAHFSPSHISRCPVPPICSLFTCPLSHSPRPASFGLPCVSPTSRPSPMEAPARDHHFLGGSFSCSRVTFVSSFPVPISNVPPTKLPATHLFPHPHPGLFINPVSTQSSARASLKLTALGYSVCTAPTRPPSHRAALSTFLSPAQRGHPHTHTPPPPLSNLGWEEGAGQGLGRVGHVRKACPVPGRREGEKR